MHGERTFAHHHNSHGDAVVCAIYICVPKAVAEIELLATFPQVAVFADLCRTLHVQDTSLSFIVLYQLSKYLLDIAFSLLSFRFVSNAYSLAETSLTVFANEPIAYLERVYETSFAGLNSNNHYNVL